MRSHRTAALRKGGLVLAPLALAILAAQGVVAAPLLNYKTVPQFVNLLPNPLAPGFIWQPDSRAASIYAQDSAVHAEPWTRRRGAGHHGLGLRQGPVSPPPSPAGPSS